MTATPFIADWSPPAINALMAQVWAWGRETR
jgi:hypothetical protein